MDLENNSLNVFLILENNVCYLVEVTILNFFYTLMKKFKIDFITTEYPYIILSKLTDKDIPSVIQ